jgi:hypothetical protein
VFFAASTSSTARRRRRSGIVRGSHGKKLSLSQIDHPTGKKGTTFLFFAHSRPSIIFLYTTIHAFQGSIHPSTGFQQPVTLHRSQPKHDLISLPQRSQQCSSNLGKPTSNPSSSMPVNISPTLSRCHLPIPNSDDDGLWIEWALLNTGKRVITEVRVIQDESVYAHEAVTYASTSTS